MVKNFKIDSMIDISDGLAADLGHILDESRAGAIIYEKLIPVSKDAKNFKEALFMGRILNCFLLLRGPRLRR